MNLSLRLEASDEEDRSVTMNRGAMRLQRALSGCRNQQVSTDRPSTSNSVSMTDRFRNSTQTETQKRHPNGRRPSIEMLESNSVSKESDPSLATNRPPSVELLGDQSCGVSPVMFTGRDVPKIKKCFAKSTSIKTVRKVKTNTRVTVTSDSDITVDERNSDKSTSDTEEIVCLMDKTSRPSEFKSRSCCTKKSEKSKSGTMNRENSVEIISNLTKTNDSQSSQPCSQDSDRTVIYNYSQNSQGKSSDSGDIVCIEDQKNIESDLELIDLTEDDVSYHGDTESDSEASCHDNQIRKHKVKKVCDEKQDEDGDEDSDASFDEAAFFAKALGP